MMRAKVRVSGIVRYPDDGSPVTQETVTFTAVSKSAGYPADGSDEDNTYARYTPSGEIRLAIQNPALIGKFAIDDRFYVDFSPAE